LAISDLCNPYSEIEYKGSENNSILDKRCRLEYHLKYRNAKMVELNYISERIEVNNEQSK